MAINLVDSGSTISLEFTVDYNAGSGTISAQKVFINKDDFEVGYEGTLVVIRDTQKNAQYKILYSDITTPSGASASAVADLIEAFQDTASSAVTITGDALTSLQLIDDAIATTGSAVPAKATQVSGTDGTNARTIATNTSGSVLIGADEKHIGAVGGNSTIIKVTGANVGVDGAAYATGDTLGDKSPIMIAPGRVIGGTGIIHSVTVQDLSKQSIALDVVIFDANPTGTTFTDNSALDIADADLPKVIGIVTITAGDYAAFNDSSVAHVRGLSLPFQCISSTSLWFALVTRGSPTYVADELSIAFGVLQD